MVTLEIVKEIPFIHIEALSIKLARSFLTISKSNKYDLSIFLILFILPTASMWPWQICPDIFWPNFKGSSRLILSFIFKNLNLIFV